MKQCEWDVVVPAAPGFPLPVTTVRVRAHAAWAAAVAAARQLKIDSRDIYSVVKVATPQEEPTR